VRSLRHLITLVIAASLMVLAASVALGSDTNSLNLVKSCATFPTTHTCVVTSSNVGILLGSTFHYLDPSKLGSSGSPMLITTAPGVPEGTASGKCQFRGTTGHCRFTSGTGSLAGFHANAQVLSIPGGFSLTGTYHFSGDGDDSD
jgi:hypothetical protein